MQGVLCLNTEDKQHMQQELEARRQDIIAKERSLDQAEAAAEKRWAKLTEDVSAKVNATKASLTRCVMSYALWELIPSCNVIRYVSYQEQRQC